MLKNLARFTAGVDDVHPSVVNPANGDKKAVDSSHPAVFVLESVVAEYP